MISEGIFTCMSHIKGYLFRLRTVTLTFPVYKLSAIDISEKKVVTCSSFLNGILDETSQLSDLSALDRSEICFLICCSFTIWNI